MDRRALLLLVMAAGLAIAPPVLAAGLIEARRLARERGWTPLQWTPAEKVAGIGVEIDGRAEFRDAEIQFDDGAVERIALAGERRGRGLYALIEFPAERGVTGVTVTARARSARAEVAIRLFVMDPRDRIAPVTAAR